MPTDGVARDVSVQVSAREAAPDLVLVQAPIWGISTPPLALAMLSAWVRQHGYRVRPVDLNVECYLARGAKYERLWELEESLLFWQSPSRVEEFILDFADLFEAFVASIAEARPRAVGFTFYHSSCQISLHLAGLIKARAPETTILAGGPHASRYMAGRSMALHPGIDVVVQGEGELALLEILDRLRTGESVDDCPGTITKRDGVAVDHGDRAVMANLGALPFPDFSDLDFSRYRDPFKLPMMSSRGCVNRCIFCNERPFWRGYRGMPAERIFAEIESQMARYPQVDTIDFQDSAVNGNIRELERFADLVIASGRKIRWTGQAVIRREMTFELASKLVQSGCSCLAFGLETASTSLMRTIGKNAANGAAPEQVIKDCARAGLGCAYNFMFGLPGETDLDAQNSMDLLRRCAREIGTVNPSPAFCGFCPGTLGFENPEKYGIDLTANPNYWRSTDGTNTFLTRLARFEAFCSLVDDLKIPTTYRSRLLMDRERAIANYHLVQGNSEEAAKWFKEWLAREPNDRSARARLDECERQLGAG